MKNKYDVIFHFDKFNQSISFLNNFSIFTRRILVTYKDWYDVNPHVASIWLTLLIQEMSYRFIGIKYCVRLNK